MGYLIRPLLFSAAAQRVNMIRMITHWFDIKRRRQTASTLRAIYLATAAGEPMQGVASIEAVCDQGLKGDRYAAGLGHWQLIEACQVTLITEHDLQKARKNTRAHIQAGLDDGSHRRNLVIDGLKCKDLEDQTFRIGTAVFRYQKPRPPCGYIDQIAGDGMGRALSHNSGICIRVINSGRLTVGDMVEILTQT